jgi:hypothetical protein
VNAADVEFLKSTPFFGSAVLGAEFKNEAYKQSEIEIVVNLSCSDLR